MADHIWSTVNSFAAIPPFCINTPMTSSNWNTPFIFRSVWPFVALQLLVLFLLIAAPGIALWLPAQMR